jgi:AcrR family transcriptional regulator
MARKSDPAKRIRIIDAATQVFARKGYNGTIMSEVAQVAGIGKGTIYEYFRSKEALFFAVFEHLMNQTREHLQRALAITTGSIARHLETLSDGLMHMWLPQLDLYALVLEFWSATATRPGGRQFKQAFQKAYTELRHLLADQIQSGYEKGEFKASADPIQIAAVLIGTWDALLIQAWLDPGFDPLSASRQHMQLIIRGLMLPTPLEVS